MYENRFSAVGITGFVVSKGSDDYFREFCNGSGQYGDLFSEFVQTSVVCVPICVTQNRFTVAYMRP